MTPDKFADESLAAFEARIKKAQAAFSANQIPSLETQQRKREATL